MLSVEEVRQLYLDWMLAFIRDPFYLTIESYISFERLLHKLHEVEFTYTIPRDHNRECDGKALRDRFLMGSYGTVYDTQKQRVLPYSDEEIDVYRSYLRGPCSILEMMLALALRCEETIMDDPTLGNRTSYWFWKMNSSLGLGSMFDDRYDEERVDAALTRFLARDYEPNGRGGLFTLRKCDQDLRKVEIWNQMGWYLNEFL